MYYREPEASLLLFDILPYYSITTAFLGTCMPSKKKPIATVLTVEAGATSLLTIQCARSALPATLKREKEKGDGDGESQDEDLLGTFSLTDALVRDSLVVGPAAWVNDQFTITSCIDLIGTNVHEGPLLDSGGVYFILALTLTCMRKLLWELPDTSSISLSLSLSLPP